MRLLGLDYGSKTVGVALTDPTGLIVQGREIIRRDKENRLRPTLRRIAEICEGEGVDAVVLGYPLNMDDTAGDRALKTEAFRRLLLERTGVPVFFFFFRLTTCEAEDIMREAGVSGRDFKEHVDKVAAMVILREFLENHKDGLEEMISAARAEMKEEEAGSGVESV